MYNYIKSKALVVQIRKAIIVFLLLLTVLMMVGCEETPVEVTTVEFELVSCYVEYRNVTNGFGGIMRTDEILHYGYIDGGGQVVFDEQDFESYYIDFKITEETPKLIITYYGPNVNYTFKLTREMYKNLNTNQ